MKLIFETVNFHKKCQDMKMCYKFLPTWPVSSFEEVKMVDIEFATRSPWSISVYSQAFPRLPVIYLILPQDIIQTPGGHGRRVSDVDIHPSHIRG